MPPLASGVSGGGFYATGLANFDYVIFEMLTGLTMLLIMCTILQLEKCVVNVMFQSFFDNHVSIKFFVFYIEQLHFSLINHLFSSVQDFVKRVTFYDNSSWQHQIAC